MGLAPIRYTKQFAPDGWMTQCKVCPKRHGRHVTATEQASDDWWAEHVQSRGHLANVGANGTLSEEQRTLAAIFGENPQMRPANWVPPNERVGQVLVREHARFRENDNPRG